MPAGRQPTTDLAYIAVFAALIAALALVPSIPIGPVPITLQTLGAIRGNVIPFVRVIAFVVAFGLFVAFMCVPTAILFHLVDAPMSDAAYQTAALAAGIL